MSLYSIMIRCAWKIFTYVACCSWWAFLKTTNLHGTTSWRASFRKFTYWCAYASDIVARSSFIRSCPTYVTDILVCSKTNLFCLLPAASVFRAALIVVCLPGDTSAWLSMIVPRWFLPSNYGWCSWMKRKMMWCLDVAVFCSGFVFVIFVLFCDD